MNAQLTIWVRGVTEEELTAMFEAAMKKPLEKVQVYTVGLQPSRIVEGYIAECSSEPDVPDTSATHPYAPAVTFARKRTRKPRSDKGRRRSR